MPSAQLPYAEGAVRFLRKSTTLVLQYVAGELANSDEPGDALRWEYELPVPNAGFGGAEMSISPSQKFVALLIYSGQCEVGYEVFELSDESEAPRHIVSFPYEYGTSDLTPPVFAPDEHAIAIALQEESLWWVDPDAEEADWNTPAAGGDVTWARLYVHQLSDDDPHIIDLVVHLPEGWLPDDDLVDEYMPQRLKFPSANQVSVHVPWHGDVAIELDKSVARLPSPGAAPGVAAPQS